jgi:membrane protein EpsK
MRQSHIIAYNAIIMWAARAFALVPQLIIVPLLIDQIGESGYGVYALVWSLIMSITQLQMSLQSGVVKYSAGYLAQDRMEDVNQVIGSSFVYSVGLAVLACAGVLLAAAFYDDPSGQIVSMLVVVGVMVLFIFPLTPYVAIIRSKQMFYVGAVADVVSKYVSLAAVIAWFYVMTPSVEAVIVIMAASLFLARIIQVPIAYRVVPGLRNRLRLFNAPTFRLIAAFGAITVLNAICLTINTTGVRWLMEVLESTAFVAHLAIMLMPGVLLAQILGAMVLTVMPATSGYDATGNMEMLRELLTRGMRYMMILALAAMLGAALLVRNALTLWVGEEYAFLTPYTLALFAGGAFVIVTSISHHMLKGMGRLRVVILISAVGHVLVPVTAIVLAYQQWQDPYWAVTAGLCAGNAVYGVLLIGAGIKAVGASAIRFMYQSCVQPLIAFALVAGASYAVVAYGGYDGLIQRVAITAIAESMLFVAAYALIASATERAEFKEALRGIRGYISARFGKSAA